jgi:hypothetical protein
MRAHTKAAQIVQTQNARQDPPSSGSTITSTHKELKLRRNEWRITKMVLAIFLSFVVCYLPITIIKVTDHEVRYPGKKMSLSTYDNFQKSLYSIYSQYSLLSHLSGRSKSVCLCEVIETFILVYLVCSWNVICRRNMSVTLRKILQYPHFKIPTRYGIFGDLFGT